MGKILVVEDSLIVNQHIRKTFEFGNYGVISIFSEAGTIQSANEGSPNLILMDILMESSSDGIDATI